MSKVTIDPITFEIFSHKLWQITNEMGIALSRVSGSAITIEAKDFMAGLFDADGNLISGGSGVLYHNNVFQDAIKYILQEYGKDPGIKEGDTFLLNDPYIGCVHKPDAAVLTPLFHKGKRIAWSATMTHLMDVGGIDIGGFCPRATDIFQEGFCFRGIKIAEDGKPKKDVFNSILSMSRDPAMVGLDLRGEMAAGNVAARRTSELVEHFGVDYFIALCKQTITYSEERLRARLSGMADGAWEGRTYFDSDGMTQRIYRIALKLTKRGTSLVFDFSESDEQAPSFINGTAVGLKGAVFGAIAPLLAYDIPWNQGITNCTQVICPEGLIINAKFPAPCSLSSIGATEYAMNLAAHCICQMLNCNEHTKDEVSANWGVVGGGITFSGLNQRGEFVIANPMDHEALGGGAKRYSDGVDCGGHFLIPTGSAPNVEASEAMYPILYLYRRRAIDTGGAGKFRGGVGGERAILLHDAPEGRLQSTRKASGVEVPVVFGLSGGYPAGNTMIKLVKNSDILERLKGGDIPSDIESLKGDVKMLPAHGILEIQDGDVVVWRHHGGGGYGDPIDRLPELVRRDVINGLVSLKSGYELYGVVIQTQNFQVDIEGTERRRKEIREARLEVGGDKRK